MGAPPSRLAWQRFAVHAGPQPSGRVPWDELWADGLALRVLDRGAPGPVPSDLRAHAQATLAANVVRLQAARELAGALDAVGVPYVLLKGGAMLVLAPHSVRTRAMSDLDVLVDPADFTTAQRIAEGLGYRRVDAPRPVSERWTCELELRRTDGAFVSAIDLHRGLHHGALWRALSSGVLARRVRVDGVAIPSADDALLVIAAHRARHAYRGDLRELADAWDLLPLVTDADALAALADASHVAGALWALVTSVAPWGDRGAAVYAALGGRVPSVFQRRLLASVRAASRWTPREQTGAAPRFASMYTPLVAGGVPLLDATRAAVTHGALRLGDRLATRFGR